MSGKNTTRKKNRKRNAERNQASKRELFGSALKIGLTFVVIIAAAIFLLTGSVKTQIGNESLTVSASLSGSSDVAYKDIISMEYAKDIDLGNRDFGVGSTKLQAGDFSNDAYGDYQLYSYKQCKLYIVIKTKDEYVVLNNENEETTKELYNEIEAAIKKSK